MENIWREVHFLQGKTAVNSALVHVGDITKAGDNTKSQDVRESLCTTQPRDHEDFIAEKAFNSLCYCNLVHALIPTLQAMKEIPDALDAVDKKWEKIEKLLAWQVIKVFERKKAIEMAQTEGMTIHFGTPMDLCHLKNSELEQQFQKYKGGVILRRDVVKDDSGWHSVFTEKCSSKSQITASKQSGCNRQTNWMTWTRKRLSIGLHPSQKRRRSNTDEISWVRMSRNLDTSTTVQVAKRIAQHWRISCGLGQDLVRTTSCRVMGETIQEDRTAVHRQRRFFYPFTCATSNWQ